MIRYTPSFFPTLLLVSLAILGPFFFPVPFAIIIGIVAALFFPPAAMIVGGLLDVLYFGGLGTHGTFAFPYYTICGVIVTIGAAFVHEFVKTRIIS
jgi:hypothetical protein